MTTVRLKIGTRTFPDLEATIDAADLPAVQRLSWHPAKRRNGFYVVAKRPGIGAVYLHRYLMDAPEGFDVDHVDGNPLNNSRSNLRICSHQENMQASSLRRFGEKPPPSPRPPPRAHVVKVALADGTMREYVYPPRGKKGNVRRTKL